MELVKNRKVSTTLTVVLDMGTIFAANFMLQAGMIGKIIAALAIFGSLGMMGWALWSYYHR